MASEETLHITPTRARFLGTNFTFATDSGEVLGEFSISFTKNNRLLGPGLDLRFGHELGFAPTFHVRRDGERLAEVRYNVLTGGMELVRRDGETMLFQREGLLLPKVTLRDAGKPVLVVEADRLYGRHYTATLHPDETWSRDDLIALLALVFHTKVSLGILLAGTGGGTSVGLLSPI